MLVPKHQLRGSLTITIRISLEVPISHMLSERNITWSESTNNSTDRCFDLKSWGCGKKKQQTFGKRRGYLSFAYLWLATFNMKCIVRLVEEVFRKLHRVARCLTIARGLWIIHTYIRICSTYSHIIHKIILHRCNCCILMLTRKILRMKRQDACYNTEMEVK